VAGPGPGVRHRAGQAHRPRNDHRAWRTLLADSGVRPARLHDARHIAAALLLAQGVPPRVAMQALGHSQIGLTLGTYSHVVPELSQEAAAAMTRALWIAPQVVEQPAEETSDETLAATLAASPPKPTGVTPPMSLLTCEDAVGRPGIEPGTRGLKGRSVPFETVEFRAELSICAGQPARVHPAGTSSCWLDVARAAPHRPHIGRSSVSSAQQRSSQIAQRPCAGLGWPGAAVVVALDRARPVPIGSDPHPHDLTAVGVLLRSPREGIDYATPGREDARRHLRRPRQLRTRPDARTRRRRPPRGAGPRPARRPATPVHRRAGPADPRPARRRRTGRAQIAATFGVGRSTAYRALQAPPARTPPPRRTPEPASG